MATTEPRRPVEKAHDEAPSNIVDHPFEPRGEWYTLCVHCGLAMAAHRDTTIDAKEHMTKRRGRPAISYVGDGDDVSTGRLQIGYVGDEDDD